MKMILNVWVHHFLSQDRMRLPWRWSLNVWVHHFLFQGQNETKCYLNAWLRNFVFQGQNEFAIKVITKQLDYLTWKEAFTCLGDTSLPDRLRAKYCELIISTSWLHCVCTCHHHLHVLIALRLHSPSSILIALCLHSSSSSSSVCVDCIVFALIIIIIISMYW